MQSPALFAATCWLSVPLVPSWRLLSHVVLTLTHTDRHAPCQLSCKSTPLLLPLQLRRMPHTPCWLLITTVGGPLSHTHLMTNGMAPPLVWHIMIIKIMMTMPQAAAQAAVVESCEVVGRPPQRTCVHKCFVVPPPPLFRCTLCTWWERGGWEEC